MNISANTIKKLSADFQISFWDDNVNDVSVEEAVILHIGWDKDGTGYFGKDIKVTKKETTYEYVINKLNSDTIYKNFSEYFNTLISKKGLRGYPTTYGIGVECIFSPKKEDKSNIETILNSLGVRYTTEYSEAGWVYRYKISKSKENIEIIKNLLSII